MTGDAIRKNSIGAKLKHLRAQAAIEAQSFLWLVFWSAHGMPSQQSGIGCPADISTLLWSAGWKFSAAELATGRMATESTTRSDKTFRTVIIQQRLKKPRLPQNLPRRADIRQSLAANSAINYSRATYLAVLFAYTNDATAFTPGSGMLKGKAAIAEMWTSMAEQVSDPKVETLKVKRLGPLAMREIGTFSLKTKGPAPKEITGKYVVVWERWQEVGSSEPISRTTLKKLSYDVCEPPCRDVRCWHISDVSECPLCCRYRMSSRHRVVITKSTQMIQLRHSQIKIRASQFDD